MSARLLALFSSVLLAALPLAAHHPFSAEYDWTKPVTVTATVTQFDWSNPHAHVIANVKDSAGKPATWTFEMGNLDALKKAGWDKTTIKAGDTITVDAWMAKAKTNMANVKSIRLANGRELSGASSILDISPSKTSTSN
jgi:lipopolysaccharide export system protein LptA